MFFVYILRCNDKSFYTGTAKNIENRMKIHSRGKGSKYVKTRLPIELVYSEKHDTLSAALKREIQIKRLTRKEKEKLITYNS